MELSASFTTSNLSQVRNRTLGNCSSKGAQARRSLKESKHLEGIHFELKESEPCPEGACFLLKRTFIQLGGLLGQGLGPGPGLDKN